MAASSARRIGARLATAAAVVALLVGAGSLLPGQASSAQAATASWKTVRTEQFSGSALPAGCGTYAGNYAGGTNAWTDQDVAISGGRLNLTLEKRATGGRPYSSGGIGCWGAPQKYGRYELRARVPSGAGIDSSITLVPAGNVANATTSVELLAPGPSTAVYVTNGNGASTAQARTAGSYAGAFHTYVIEWAPQHVLVSVDGKPLYFSADAYPGSRWLGMVLSTGDALTGLPDATTRLPAQFQIDRLTISSYTGVALAAPAGPLPATASPTPSPSLSSPAPAPTAKRDAQAQASDRSLPGGTWPWLLGGSLLAAGAGAGLNYARTRRASRRPPASG